MNFGELSGNIREKENQIQALRHRIPALITINEKLKLSIAQECREEALEIAKEIKSLREKNETDSAILAKAQAISERWNIPIGDFHRLDYLETQTHDHLAELQSQLQSTLKTLNFSPDNSAAAHRQQNLVEQITQAKEYLEKIAGAKKELAGIISE